MKFLPLGLLLAGLLWDTGAARADAFSQSARTVDRFDYVEVTLQLDQPVAGNPFIDAELTGEFGPAGQPAKRLDGFCDGDEGRTFRIRFMPSAEGRHRYGVTFRAGGRELKHAGEFTARKGRHPGLVRVDAANPYHFNWDGSGEPFFYNSTTAYWLLGWRDDAVVRECIDRLARLQINRIRVALSGRTASGMRWKEPMLVANDDFQFRLEPWPAARSLDIEDPGYDVSRFNLGFFRKTERMLAHARRKDLQVSLIFALDAADKGVDPFGKAAMGGTDEQRYYRYCVARFGAFANVWWDLINEWHLCRDEAWANQMGALVKEWDPYDHTTSIHGTGRFPFRTAPWCDYAMFQSWDEHGSYDFMLKNRREQAATGRPMPQVNEEYGYEDHYPYPWGGKRIWPARIGEACVRLAWEMTLAGGYQTTGERANIAGQGGWITARGNGEMTMLPWYARLREFFERFNWWRLEPHPELVSGEAPALPTIEGGTPLAPVLGLAEPGQRYVLYLRAGGTASVQLEPGTYRVTRFNPRDGTVNQLADAAGGASWTSPLMPDTEPWVLLLEAR